MSKSVENEVKLSIVLPREGFAKTLYFNRVRVERDSGFCFVQFGLIVASELIDSYSCVLSQTALAQNRQSLLEYVTKLGPDVEEISWKGITTTRASADVADVITMSFRGQVAETIFYLFSLCGATEAARASAGVGAGEVAAQPMVLLRSTPALQKQLIVLVYGD
jgi:hypothetical protein